MRLKIIDSFAGGGGASHGITEALGRHPDIAINHDQEAVAMHSVNHPETLHFCKSVFDVSPESLADPGTVGLLWASPDCFPAGTLVLTDTGYRPIEDVDVGDSVLTHELRWKPVTKTFRSKKPLISIRGHGHFGLRVSEEHPFYARLRGAVWNNERRQYDRPFHDPDWVRAADLQKEWYWATPCKFPEANVPPIPGRGMEIDEKLMWLVGRYLGDGWTRLTDTRAELVITCGRQEAISLRVHLSKWPRAGERADANELAWHERETGTAYQFATNHRGLVLWLREHFGHRAESKGIPAWALGMPVTMREALLAGYLSADGYETEDFNEANTVSKALAFGIKSLANSLDKTVAVYFAPNRNHIGAREINARPIYHLRWRHKVSSKHEQTFREGHLEWCPVREQTDTGEIEEVFNISVQDDESYIVEGIVVHNCTHFSKAKGGKPRKKEIRDLANVVVDYARALKPNVIILENVEEFKTWGPLDDNGFPIKSQAGESFDSWVENLRKAGYKVEWRELRACDYGAPTIRKRLFVIARCDGQPIVWPQPTHGPGRIPYRTAAEIIDWSIPCPSIFERKKPLADATLRRIARGIVRYVLNSANPFIIPLTHQGADRAYPMDEPMRTVTGAHRGESALIVPFVSRQFGQSVGSAAEEPMGTVTAGGQGHSAVVAPFVSRVDQTSASHKNGIADAREPLNTIHTSNPFAAIAPTLVQTGYGEREGQEPRSLDLDKPLGTVVAEGVKHGAVAAFIAQHNSQRKGVNPGRDSRLPLSTATASGSHQQVVAAHLTHFYGSGSGEGDLNRPIKTITGGGMHAGLVAAILERFGGVSLFDQATLSIDGIEYVITDIGMRMLSPRELYRAQGFPDSYIIDPIVRGKPLTKTAQVRCCGNSVCPPLAEALVRANLPEMRIDFEQEAV